MKRLLTLILSLLFIPMALAAPKTYTIDSDHSYVLWHISHFGFSNQVGKWPVTGTLVLDADKPQNSTVNVTIQTGNIVTGNPELDKHLKGDLFFDVSHFSTATFVSNKVIVTGKDTAKVLGALTIRGVTKNVVLNARLHQMGKNPVTDKETVGFSAKTQLKRSDFGINALLPGLGDDVAIDIEIEAYVA